MRLTLNKNTVIFVFFVVGGMLFCLFVAACLLLPYFLQNNILPDLAENAGIESFSCKVRRLGLYGADLENIRLGSPSKPGIVIETLKIDFSPFDIFYKTVKEIRLNGLTIYGEYINGVFSIPGFLPLDKRKNDSDKKNQITDSTRNFIVQRIVLSKADLVLAMADRSYRVPFHIEITPLDSDMSRLLCRALVYPFGQTVELDVKIDLAANSSDIRIASKSFRLDSITAVSDRVEELKLSGKADVTVFARIGLSPLALVSVSADAVVLNPDISYGGIRTTPCQKNGDPQSVPIKLSIGRQQETPWKIRLTDLRLSSPLPILLTDFSGEMDIHENTISGSGNILVILEPFSGKDNLITLKSPFNLACDVSFNIPENGSWSFDLKNKNIHEKKSTMAGGNVKIGDFVIASGQPRFQIAVKGNGGGVVGDFNLSVNGLSTFSGPVSGKIENISAGGTIVLNPGEKPVFDLTWKSTNTQIRMEDAEMNLPKLSFMGKFENPGAPDMRFSGTAAISRANAVFPASQVHLKGISVNLPVSWPRQMNGKSGNFAIRQIRFSDMDLGPVSGKLRQTGFAFDIQGTHQSHVIPDFTVAFSGRSEFSDSDNRVSFNMDYESLPYVTPAPFDLGRLTPSAKGFTIDGGFGLAGSVSYTDRNFNVSLNADIQDATLENPDADLSVKNIRSQLFFPSLLEFKSAPKQRIEFASATVGGISIKKGFIEYQMESKDSLLIETAGFNWCNGHVDTHALRITGDKSDYNLVLYCDRLNLAMLLEQFGAAEAEGKGTVNGRIPLRYTDGRLIFKDGFLYSTPGQGGRIRVRNTEKLLAGIATGTPENVQMDLAREVLKSYDYNWATLGLATEGNDLVMRLSFNGKPTDPLPFVYEKDIGRFVKLEAGKKGSVFQGVNMDINFRLPLDTLLRYRKVFNMIQ